MTQLYNLYFPIPFPLETVIEDKDKEDRQYYIGITKGNKGRHLHFYVK